MSSVLFVLLLVIYYYQAGQQSTAHGEFPRALCVPRPAASCQVNRSGLSGFKRRGRLQGRYSF